MTELTPHDDAAPAELRRLRSRKEALQSVIKIARAIERLQKALHAVLLMGQPATAIPKQALRYYNELSREIKNRPTNTLRQDLVELDRRIKTDLQDIIALARQSETEFASATTPVGDDELDRINKRLDEFRRLSQTAVCLRILLRERGITAPPMALPVPEQSIQQHIQALDHKEREYKSRLRTNIVALKTDLDALLARGGFPESVMRELAASRAALQSNLEHLDAGKELDTLPFAVEVTEAAPGAPPDMPATPNPAPAPRQDADDEPTGFFARLWRWLNSPWSVRWSQTRTHDKRKSR